MRQLMQSSFALPRHAFSVLLLTQAVDCGRGSPQRCRGPTENLPNSIRRLIPRAVTDVCHLWSTCACLDDQAPEPFLGTKASIDKGRALCISQSNPTRLGSGQCVHAPCLAELPSTAISKSAPGLGASGLLTVPSSPFMTGHGH